MPTYRFRFLDLFGHLIAGQFHRLEDDTQARAYADKLLAEGGHSSVEVYDKDRSVYRADELLPPRPG
jgi:hypothetical protein